MSRECCTCREWERCNLRKELYGMFQAAIGKIDDGQYSLFRSIVKKIGKDCRLYNVRELEE